MVATRQHKINEKMAFIFEVYQSDSLFMPSICLLKICILSMLDANEKP